MMKKKIALVGGSGFLGSALVRILSAGADISNYDKQNSPEPDCKTIIADIKNRDDFSNTLQPADWLVLLAAVHSDDVKPTSLYYDINVAGAANVLAAVNKQNIKKVLFISSVSVYGLNPQNPDETAAAQPFDDYGKSKWQAEELMRNWQKQDSKNRTLIIVRPSVIFGPGSKGNVYQLLQQINSGTFIMVGNGRNKKSMAYIENIVHFMAHLINQNISGYHLYNYADKPDFSMTELIGFLHKSMHKKMSRLHIPYAIGYAGGWLLDTVAKLTGKKFSVSAVRIKKWSAETQCNADKKNRTGFQPPYSLQEGLQKTIAAMQRNNTKSQNNLIS